MHLCDLILAALVGVLAALVVVVVRRFAFSVSDGEKRIGMPLLLILGGLAVGLLAQTADWLGADAETVLFSGQAGVPAVVAEDSAKIVLILLVAKALAYGDLPGVRFPRWSRVPRHIPRRRAGDVARDLVRRLADTRGRGRSGSRHGAVTRMLLTPILFAALLVGPRRRRGPGGSGRGRRGVARDRGIGAAPQSQEAAVTEPGPATALTRGPRTTGVFFDQLERLGHAVAERQRQVRSR